MEWAKEAVAIVLAGVAGVWTVIRHASTKYNDLEHRLDRLERETVTRIELKDAIKDIEQKMDSNYHHMDAKIDSIKSDIMWIMQAVGKDK